MTAKIQESLSCSAAVENTESIVVTRLASDHQDVIETIPTLAWTARPDGSVEFVNRHWREYSGLSAEESAGSAWQAAVHPEDLERHAHSWLASVSTGAPFENEVRYRCAADGQYRWFLSRAVPLRDERREILKWCGIATEIDDHKRAEGLLAGEKRILEMVARGESLAQILDSLCRLVERQAPDVSASILLIKGDRLRHGGAPSLPKTYTDAIDGVVIGPNVGSCGTAAYTGKQVIVSDIASDPLWADFRDAALPHSLRACWSTPIFSPEGKVIGTFAMYYREPREPSQRDQDMIEQITHLAGVAIQHKLSDEALRASEELKRRIIESSRDCIEVLDLDGMLLFISSGGQQLLEIDDIQSYLNSCWIEFWLPEDRPKISGAVAAARGGGIGTFQAFCPSAKGTPRWWDVVITPICNADGQPEQLLSVSRDITEHKRAEAEAQENERRHREMHMELAHANRAATMGQLTASITHEVKQPITATVTNARTALRWLAREPPELEEVRQTLACIVKDSIRAADVVDRTRDLIKKAPPRKDRLDINDVIREVIELTRGEAAKNGVSVQAELAETLPLIEGDRVQLQQVIMNLIVNAVEAMSAIDDRARELRASSETDATGSVLITVRDTGPGLAPSTREQLFEPFYTTKASGLGLGLSICRSIVEAHGGRLWASANMPRGAKFEFTLPSSDA